MLSGSNTSYKPLIGLVWIGYVALIAVAILLDKISIQSAVVQFMCVVLAYLSWSSGSLSYLLSGNFYISGTNLLTKLKGKLIQLCSSFLYVLIPLTFFLFSLENRKDKAVFFLAIAILSLIWSIALYRRIRLVEDTVQTQLSSAAQGYAELEGKVKLYDNEIARGPHQEMPIMAWYAKALMSSTAGFILEDEKGRCTIDPNNAEVITPNYRYNDHSYKAIYPDERIYVLGHLETLNKQRTEFERQAMVSKKMANWKQHQSGFLELFDRNNDGAIDDNELAYARERALDLVDEELEEVYQAPATHVVSSSEDGRPFILSSIHPDMLLKRYKISLWVHLFVWGYLSILVIANHLS